MRWRRSIGRRELAQLNQRIRVRYRIEPLSRQEVEAYLDHRVRVAGCTRHLFRPGAIDRIYALSHGIPRVVNILASRALLAAFVAGKAMVEPSHVRAEDLPPVTDAPDDPAPVAGSHARPARPAAPRPSRRLAAGPGTAAPISHRARRRRLPRRRRRRTPERRRVGAVPDVAAGSPSRKHRAAKRWLAVGLADRGRPWPPSWSGNGRTWRVRVRLRASSSAARVARRPADRTPADARGARARRYAPRRTASRRRSAATASQTVEPPVEGRAADTGAVVADRRRRRSRPPPRSEVEPERRPRAAGAGAGRSRRQARPSTANPAARGDLAVHVGSFQDAARAEQLRQRLAGAGWPSTRRGTWSTASRGSASTPGPSRPDAAAEQARERLTGDGIVAYARVITVGQ